MAANQTPVIMMVDDEEMILSSLRSFFELETDYTIKTFLKPREALDWAGENRADVVISDYLMPDLDGVSFLLKFKELQPHAPRILLTGYADKENAIRAINEVGLFNYIEKPWDNDQLLLVLRNALEKVKLLNELTQQAAEINMAQGQLRGLQDNILKTFI
jgi:DNA-binding NtrC family response regulator